MKLNTRLLSVLALAGLSLLSTQSPALTPTSNFTTTVTLTPVCLLNTASAALTFGYTSFGTALTPNTSFTARCTDNLAYTISLDGTGTTGVYAYTDTATQLDFSITLKEDSTSGTTLPPAIVRNGDGTVKTYVLDASMAAGQSGRCNATDAATVGDNLASCGGIAVNRVITLTY